MLQDIRNSTLKMIDQCGHVPQEEKPEERVSLVIDFLAEVDDLNRVS